MLQFFVIFPSNSDFFPYNEAFSFQIVSKIHSSSFTQKFHEIIPNFCQKYLRSNCNQLINQKSGLIKLTCWLFCLWNQSTVYQTERRKKCLNWLIAFKNDREKLLFLDYSIKSFNKRKKAKKGKSYYHNFQSVTSSNEEEKEFFLIIMYYCLFYYSFLADC